MKYLNLRNFLLSLSIFLASPLVAGLVIFNPDDGNWNVPGNWSNGSVPGTNNMPIIHSNRKVTIDSDVLECGNIFCGQSAGNPQKGTVFMRKGGKLITSILILGRDQDNLGMYNQSGGELSISVYLSVGDNAGGVEGTASGLLKLSAGSLTMTGIAPAYIGNKGEGKMVVAGAGVFNANDMVIGNTIGSENSVFYQVGGTTFVDNVTAGGGLTSEGKCELSGGLFEWNNLFIVRDSLTIKGELSSARGAKSGGTSLQLENGSLLQFIFDANGMSPISIENSELSISSGSKIKIDGTFYTRNSGAAKSFLLVKHNGYADQTTFASENVELSGFGNLSPALRYESNGIYLDLTVSGNESRQAQGLFLKYWELPINDDSPWNRGYQKIEPPLSAVPVFSNKLVRSHPTFGKRVNAIDLSELLNEEDIFVQFNGFINITTSGSYTFYLNSDDGSKLWIDGALLVDNDGVKSSPTELSASITLSVGMHEIEVGFFHNTGTPVLEASWSGPGISKEEIPENVLYVSEFKSAFSSFYSFKRIIPDADLIYNYCPSFLYDDVDGLYKIWSGGSAVGGDYIIYKESPTIDGLLDAEIQYALSPSHIASKFDDVHACDPNVFNVSGTFYLSYSGNTRDTTLPATTRIGMAISHDRGRTFQRLHDGEHILAPSSDYTFDPNNYGVGQSAVVRANDGYWYMIYTDVDNYRAPGQITFLRVIRCSDPAFPTNKHEMINSNVPATGGVSLDLAYDTSNEEFIVITDVCDDPNNVENPLVKIRLSYYDKNWNYIRSRLIKANVGWSFGEGIAMLADLKKEIFKYSENGLEAYVFAAATSEYKTNTKLWAHWVAGDTKYIVVPENNLPKFSSPQLISEGLVFNSNATTVIYTSDKSDLENNFTIDFWAKPITDIVLVNESTNAGGISIGSNLVSPGHGAGWGDSDLHSGLGIAVGKNGVAITEHSGNYVPAPLVWSGELSDWTHVTIVLNNRTPQLFINGQFVHQGMTSMRQYIHPTVDYFGGPWWNAYGFYGGQAWNFRLWNRVLNNDEICKLPGGLAESDLPSAFVGKWLQDDPVPEGSSLGTEAFYSVVTGNKNGKTYRQFLSNDDGGRFAIEPIDGLVSVLNGNLLDYETATSNIITVCAIDDESQIYDRKFQVDISDTSMTPRFDVELNSTYFDGNSFTNTGEIITGVEDDFTVSFYAKPERSIVIPDESTTGTAGLDGGVGYVVMPQNGSEWGDANVHAGVGVSVGTNGIAVYEHGASYLPALLSWKADIMLTNWMHISIVYSSKTPSLFVNGIKMKTGLTSSQTVHPSTTIFGGGPGFGSYKGKVSEYRVQSDQSTQNDVRDNMTTWDVDNIANYKNAFLPEIIVQNHDANGSAVCYLTPYVDLSSDSYSFSLTDDSDGRFDIHALDGIITIANMADFNYFSASNHNVTARISAGGKTYQQDITIHVAENVIPEPALFIIFYLSFIIYYLRKIS